MRALFAAALLALAGCEITPSYVESVDIDDAMARNHFKTVCKGLEMKDDDTRRYATTKLALTTAYSADQTIPTGIRRVVVSLDDSAIGYTVQVRGAGGLQETLAGGAERG